MSVDAGLVENGDIRDHTELDSDSPTAARMRTPSDNLLQLLHDQRLCSQRDIERCEAVVNRLASDLPDFDSVWLDALVRNRVLTPWQADRILTPQPVRIGPYVLQDQIGRNAFRAVKDDATVVVLERLPNESTLPGSSLRAFPELIGRLQTAADHAPRSLNLPTEIVTGDNDESFAVSHFEPGWSVDELIIRGGRMPWRAVVEIGRQLFEALAWLEEHGECHGNMNTRHLRIRTDGHAVLVSPFVRRLHAPIVSFSATLQLRDVETMAPELVGQGHLPDRRSELYSAGCVLWQLLTARSPILSTDAVNKVVKSQAADIPDVRTIVPDCPEWMARSLMNLTRRTPDLRPQDVRTVAATWQNHSASGVRETRRLIRPMPDRKHVARGPERPTTLVQKLAPIAVMTLLMAVFTAWGLRRGLLPNPLMMVSPVATAEADPVVVAERPATDERPSGPIALPQPDAAGVILLESGRHYFASDIDFAGNVYIEASDRDCAVVLVKNDQPWSVSVQQLVMSGIQINTVTGDEQSAAVTPSAAVASSAARRSATSPTALLHVECDVLSVSRSILQVSEQSPADSCLSWTSLSGDSTVLSISDSVVSGTSYGVRLNDVPGRIKLENVLMSAGVSALRCDVSDRRSRLMVNLNRVTQRDGHAFLDVVATSSDATDIHCEILNGESVLAPAMALVRLAGPDQWSRSDVRIDFLLPERGNPTIVPPSVEPAVALDRSLRSLVNLNEGQVTTDSLLMAAPQFTSPERSVQGSTLLDYEGPKLSSVMPGILQERMPQSVQPPSVEQMQTFESHETPQRNQMRDPTESTDHSDEALHTSNAGGFHE